MFKPTQSIKGDSLRIFGNNFRRKGSDRKVFQANSWLRESVRVRNFFVYKKAGLIKLFWGDPQGKKNSFDEQELKSGFAKCAGLGTLDVSNEDIFILRQIFEKTKEQKLGLFQKLFNGIWRVNPLGKREKNYV